MGGRGIGLDPTCQPGFSPGLCRVWTDNRAAIASETQRRSLREAAAVLGNISAGASLVGLLAKHPYVVVVVAPVAAVTGWLSVGFTCAADWNTRACFAGVAINSVSAGLGSSLIKRGAHVAVGVVSISGILASSLGYTNDAATLAGNLIPGWEAWWNEPVF